MKDYIIYIIESSACMALFFGLFFLMLKKESYHNLLRGYILFSIVASLAIPVIPGGFMPGHNNKIVAVNIVDLVPNTHKTNQEIKSFAPTQTVTTRNSTQNNSYTIQKTDSNALSLQGIIFLIYVLGLVFFIIKFIVNLLRIYLLIRRNKPVIRGNAKLICLNSDSSSFSFLNYIFLNRDALSIDEEQCIINHELIHVNQKHSFDILFLELVKIVFWFNPFIWWFKAYMVRLHEYYADEQLLKDATSTVSYKELLYKQYLGKYSLALVHSFNSSLLKKRIEMMNKGKSGKAARLKLLLVLPILLIGLYAFTSTKPAISKTNFNSDHNVKIEALMDYYIRTNQFSGNILVYEGNRLEYQKSNGYADFKSKQEMNINTPFLLGSATESFTSVAIMILIEEGKLKYTDSLAQYFNDLPVCMNPVNILQLLTHTSGIPPMDDYWPCESGVTTNKSIYELIKKMDRLYFSPGTDFRGSSTGYVLLAMIIEKASHQTYEQFIKENILSPAKMKDTYFLNEQNFYANNRAIGFRKDGMVFDYPQFTLGNSGIVTTVFDLHNFENALYGGQIVSMDELKKALSPVKLPNGKELSIGNGFEIFGNSNGNISGHYSWYGGTKTVFLHDIEKNSTIIAMTNNSWPRFWEMIAKIGRIIGDKPYKLPTDKDSIEMDNAILKNLMGNYKMENNDLQIKINMDNNKPNISFYPFEESYELYAETPERLFIKEFDLQFELHKNQTDSVTSFTIISDEDALCMKVK